MRSEIERLKKEKREKAIVITTLRRTLESCYTDYAQLAVEKADLVRQNELKETYVSNLEGRLEAMMASAKTDMEFRHHDRLASHEVSSLFAVRFPRGL